jgi:hypothetical protein
MSKRSKKSTRSNGNGKSSPTPTNARSRRLKPAKPAPLTQQDVQDSNDAPIPNLGRPPKPAKPAVASQQDSEDLDDAPIPNLGRAGHAARMAAKSSNVQTQAPVLLTPATSPEFGQGTDPLDPADFMHSALENLWFAAETIKDLYRLYASLGANRMSYHLEQEPRPLPGWDGKIDPRDALRRSVWIKLARSCLRHRVDPTVLFNAVLCECPEGSSLLPPDQCILNEGSTNRIELLRSLSVRDSKSKYSVTVRNLSDEVKWIASREGCSEAIALRRVLRNSTYGYLSVHRFELAWDLQDVSLIRPLLIEATIQNAFQSAFWQKIETTGSMPGPLTIQRRELDELVSSDLLDEGGPCRG